MGQIKKLFGDAAIYGASSIFGRAINFLLVPLYTSVFAPSEYGVVTELYAYVAFFMVVYLYGMETTFFRFSTKYEDVQKFFNASLSFLLAIGLLLTTLLILGSDSIAGWLAYPQAGKYVTWLALVLFLDSLVAIPFARLRLQNKARKFALFKILNICINVGFNLFFLVFGPKWNVPLPEHGVGYVFLSNLVASIATLVFFFKDFTQFKPSYNRQTFLEMLSYASPLVLIGLAGVTNEMLSRALLRHWLPEGFYPGFTNLAILGIFGACYKLSMLMNLSVQAFRYAYEPFFFSKSQDRNSPELFAKVMNAFIVFGCVAFMGVSLVLPDIAPILLRQGAYLEALHVVPMLLFGGLLLGIFYNLSVWYKVADKTKYGAIISIVGALGTVLLNWMLIPIYGYEGSAMATVSIYMIMVVISYLWGQKHFHVPYQWTRGLAYLTIAGISVTLLYLHRLSPVEWYSYGIGAILFFLLLAFILERFLSRSGRTE